MTINVRKWWGPKWGITGTVSVTRIPEMPDYGWTRARKAGEDNQRGRDIYHIETGLDGGFRSGDDAEIVDKLKRLYEAHADRVEATISECREAIGQAAAVTFARQSLKP